MGANTAINITDNMRYYLEAIQFCWFILQVQWVNSFQNKLMGVA